MAYMIHPHTFPRGPHAFLVNGKRQLPNYDVLFVILTLGPRGDDHSTPLGKGRGNRDAVSMIIDMQSGRSLSRPTVTCPCRRYGQGRKPI
jgi:hypothetical protein